MCGRLRLSSRWLVAVQALGCTLRVSERDTERHTAADETVKHSECICSGSVTVWMNDDWYFHKTGTQHHFWYVIVSDEDVMSRCDQKKQNTTSRHCDQNHKQGNILCHSSQRTEYYRNNNKSKKINNTIKKVRNTINSYKHINMMLDK